MLPSDSHKYQLINCFGDIRAPLSPFLQYSSCCMLFFFSSCHSSISEQHSCFLKESVISHFPLSNDLPKAYQVGIIPNYLSLLSFAQPGIEGKCFILALKSTHFMPCQLLVAAIILLGPSYQVSGIWRTVEWEVSSDLLTYGMRNIIETELERDLQNHLV